MRLSCHSPTKPPANYEKLRANPTTKLHGDYDVFGDASVMILSSPGHTPGHQSLLVKLPKTGAVLVTGDAAHFRENWDTPRAPVQEFRRGRDDCIAAELKAVAAANNAQVWINHDVAQTATLRMCPAYYE